MTLSFCPCISFLWGSYDILRYGETRSSSPPLPLNFVRQLFGNLHVRYYTRACACPLYVPSYLHLHLFDRFDTPYVSPIATCSVI